MTCVGDVVGDTYGILQIKPGVVSRHERYISGYIDQPKYRPFWGISLHIFNISVSEILVNIVKVTYVSVKFEKYRSSYIYNAKSDKYS